jgi:hypothetical protein
MLAPISASSMAVQRKSLAKTELIFGCHTIRGFVIKAVILF